MPGPDAEGLRTLLVGIDGASRDVLAARGEEVVPTITGLLEDGASGPLESQLPPWTPSAWPSLFTGVNPGKHGVFGFLAFEGYDWDVVNYSDVRAHALWELLSERGHTSVVVNVPVTHPPRAFDGALVPGYVAPESPECHPEGLLAELEAEIGTYQIYADTGSDVGEATRIERYEDLVASRGEAFRFLADRFDPDFGFLQFQQTDTVFHESPDNDAVVDAVYAAVDDQIATTIEACDPDVVVIASDHGIGPYDGYEFRANSFLRDRGDVRTTVGAGGMPSWDSIARNRLQAGGDGRASESGADPDGADADGAVPDAADPDEADPDPETDGDDASSPIAAGPLVERALATAARVGLTSQRIGRVARRLGIEERLLEIVPADAVRAAAEQVDFAESRAYVRDRIELGVRINLEGREPEGVVSVDEYEALRSELIDALSGVRTPDGDPVFEAVLRREDVYHGPHLEDAPDVVLVPAAFEHFLSASLRDEQFGPPTEPWNHKREGIVAIAGDVDATATLDGAHLFDVAPTVLATLGVPAAERMDGAVLPPVAPAGVEPYPQYEGESVPTQDQAVEDRLEQLGYLAR